MGVAAIRCAHPVQSERLMHGRRRLLRWLLIPAGVEEEALEVVHVGRDLDLHAGLGDQDIRAVPGVHALLAAVRSVHPDAHRVAARTSSVCQRSAQSCKSGGRDELLRRCAW